ncbi:MAG: hypothetical protein GY915_03570 [bacterium]|nr:hypothetical protein [bacterium]
MVEKNYTTFQENPEHFKEKAQKQWQDLKSTLIEHLNAKILEITPQKGLVDQTFTADASLSFILEGNKPATLLSRFSHPERGDEVGQHHQFLKKAFPNRTFASHDFPCEGTGDNIYDPFRHVFWSGYTKAPEDARAASGRSSRKAHETLSQTMGVEVIPLEVQRPFFRKRLMNRIF